MKKEFGNFILIPAIYSAGITLAIYAAIQELHKFNNSSQFLIFTAAIFIIIISEIIINYIARSKKVVLNMNFSDDINEISHLFNKIVLPLALYAFIIGFGYYNLSSTILNIVLVLTFVLFFILFVNIRSFFKDALSIESKTHFVYDFFKFIIFFLGVDVIVNYSKGNAIEAFGGVLALSLSLHLLLLIRQKLSQRRFYLYGILGSIIIATSTSILVSFNRYNQLQISLCIIFIFYLSLAIIQHAISRTLTRSVLFEYLLVLLIALSILLGVS
ncbi:MAG: hypothetical protein ACMG57_01570 [Candidatus Dojkabacteria bacterium]